MSSFDPLKTVDNVMTHALVTCTREEPVDTVRQLMLDNGVHCIPVVDTEGHPLGVVSTWDMMNGASADTRIENVMTKDVVSIAPDKTVAEAASEMMVNYVHHLVVVDETMHVVGVLSSFDLLGEVAELADTT